MLVRRLLHQRLAAYYAQSADAVVGSVNLASNTAGPAITASPLALSRLWGQWHWKRLYARLYENNRGQWLTPVELFQPYYSNTIANFIVSSLSVDADVVAPVSSLDSETKYNDNNNNSQQHTTTTRMTTTTTRTIPEFDIVELGGGRGTNALHILNHLQQQHSQVYEKLQTYYLIDASPTLHQLQRETLLLLTSSLQSSMSSSSHASRLRFEQKNLVDVAEGRVSLLPPSSSLTSSSSSSPLQYRPTIVVACEVLDNLPHDKIRVIASDRSSHRTIIQQAELIPSTSSSSDDCGSTELQEVFCPLRDALIRRAVESNSSSFSCRTTALSNTPAGEIVRWIPTVACGVLEQLQRERPNFGLVWADFDWLPPPDLDTNAPTASRRQRRSIPAQDGSEPLVTSMYDIDYPCYLSAPTPRPSPSNANNGDDDDDDDDDDDLCDILFPTDFDFLSKFIQNQHQQPPQQSSQHDALYNNRAAIQVQKQADFLKEYGPEQVEQTKSWLTGYSPMVDDFGNCSVLTMRPRSMNIAKQK
jgi:Putative S-adenosyl-L-methionine-dependent methyltransferase